MLRGGGKRTKDATFLGTLQGREVVREGALAVERRNSGSRPRNSQRSVDNQGLGPGARSTGRVAMGHSLRAGCHW